MLVALAEHFEKQCGVGLRQRHVAEFIKSPTTAADKLALQPPPMLIPRFDQFVDRAKRRG
jgi:hypothetical protein